MRELAILALVLLMVAHSRGVDTVDKTTKNKNPVEYGPWSKTGVDGVDKTTKNKNPVEYGHTRVDRGDKTTKNKNPVDYGPWSKKDMRIALVGDLDIERRKKTAEKFNGKMWAVKNGHSWSYSDWSSANQQDGFLCRISSDCTWLDTDLECYGIQPSVKSDLWFGGDVQDIVGSCRCLDNFWWDEDDLLCQRWGVARYEGLLTWHIVLIVLASVAGGCCLCEGFGRVRRYFAILRARREEAKNKARDRETAEEQDEHLGEQFEM